MYILLTKSVSLRRDILSQAQFCKRPVLNSVRDQCPSVTHSLLWKTSMQLLAKRKLAMRYVLVPMAKAPEINNSSLKEGW